MMKLIATAESVDQAQALIDSGVDELIIGEEVFGLRLPGYLSMAEMEQVIDAAHQAGKRVLIAMNAILHNDKIKQARPFLKSVRALGADGLTVGDTGLVQILKDPTYHLPYLYDASVLVTSAGQVNFWAQFGAEKALVAREVPFVELEDMLKMATIPLVYQVYGPSCIHQSKRPLLENYFNYVNKEPQAITDRQLFLSEPNREDSHYSIYTDSHGTHIFANKDLNLIRHLETLAHSGLDYCYLDGLFSSPEGFVQVVKAFLKARQAIKAGQVTADLLDHLDQTIQSAHPHNRELDTGFFLYEASTVQ